jgi:polysaccharide export outer membrane protein
MYPSFTSVSRLMLPTVLFALPWFAVPPYCSAQRTGIENKQGNRVTASQDPGSTPNDASPHSKSVPDLLIGAGDLLEVSIFGAADFTHQVRVSSGGDISLPLIGAVQVSGLNPEQAEKVIHDKLVEGAFYKNPQVSVFVREYDSGGVYVLGEVQKPGFYPLVNIRRLLEAISVAGGTTPRAGKTVTITNPNRPDRTITFNQSNDGGKVEHENVEMMAGDTVTVSKAGIVYVVGDVHQPSGIVMEHGELTVLQAIAMAQGTNPTASLEHAKLIRKTADGPQEISISLKKILSARAPDLKLQSDDIVFVPSSASRSAGRRGLETAIQAATGILIWHRY